MDEFHEDQIWDMLMESARGRIDYELFSRLFPFSAHNFLSSIIYGFAMDRSVDTIAGNIAAQVSQTGNAVDLPALTGFIETSQPALRLEVSLTRSALAAIARGEDPEAVYLDVQRSLEAAP